MVKRNAPNPNPYPLKHGFYSPKFHEAELADLASLSDDLDAEILMLRVALRRVFEMSETSTTPAQAINFLNALGRQAVHLARLLRSNRELLAGSHGITHDIIITQISKALEDLQKK